MGAWGVGAFDNDAACDWTSELGQARDLGVVRDALRQAVDCDCYLDSFPACEALAACEVIARLKGNAGVMNAYTEPADDWVGAHPQPVPDDLVGLAISAIERVLGPDSELAELWDESESAADWREAVADLRRRVSG